ncbi:dienelactone hydrolase family protein [Arthrobacter sp. zg-Y40]|uniref:alpha/beta hydrolase n=1 Tax=unclassified Arthrobacter TaxID=235627 RepID=UPI001D13F37B|nr:MULTISPECIES: alpha/beta hydrolase-fold protein [unclassified Arthrobacter]MCC3277015.1 dienelactone hydrolase family protein [Arthrobacter sp. zg-Y20]MCC3280658.1 dienelactone hydrolase family protein [Arthrobacter sp. zg-Y40]MDK1317176.1 alpha/beta hydrolase-fold protein [Arthrobacter sp. zg.Y20]WIB07273.1 alpha/beta hydrolase-fold protein [Arthrobacter sp. zg-Y20]
MTFENPVVLWSKPEAERAGTPLLVLFHGHLANEEDLMGLTDYLPAEFTIASVRAPQAMGPGYTWFPLTADADYSVEAVVDSVSAVSDWLDGISTGHSSVSMLGFSMGMAVATSLLRHRPRDFAAVVGLSGFVVPSQDHAFFSDGELAERKVPFFWGRDQADPVIDAARIEYTHAWLNTHTALTKILYSNMGHGINMQELGHVKEFLTHTVLRGARTS